MLGLGSNKLKENQAATMQPRTTTPATSSAPSSAVADHKNRKQFKGACILPIAKIGPDPDQPRKSFPEDSIERLSRSLTGVGQLIPIIVRYVASEDRYLIVDGERRYRAALLTPLTDLTCVVDSEATRDTILEIQLVVNALREDVNPMEQARAWQRLAESRKMTHRALAEMLNYDHTVIGRKISLLGLPDDIQAAIEAGEITQEQGIGINQVDDPIRQAELAARAKAGDLTRAELRKETKKRTAGKGGKTKGKAKVATKRTFKADAGLRITAERAKGIEPAALAEAFERLAAEIRAELAQSPDAGAAAA